MDFAKKLKLLRAAQGLTQQELAERTGIPQVSISHFETGKVIPTGDWLVAIQRELHWPPDDVIFDQLNSIPGK